MKRKCVLFLTVLFLILIPSFGFANDFQTGIENKIISYRGPLPHGSLGFGILWNSLVYDKDAIVLIKVPDIDLLTNNQPHRTGQGFFQENQAVPAEDPGIMNFSFWKPKNRAYILGLKLTLKGITLGRKLYSNSLKSYSGSCQERDGNVHFSIFFDAPDPDQGI